MYRREFFQFFGLAPFLFRLKDTKLPKRQEPEFIPVPHPKADTKLVRYSTDPNDPGYNHFVSETSAVYSGM